VVATATGAKPESLSSPATTTGTYTVTAVSRDLDAPSTSLSVSYPVTGYADVTVNLRDPSGTVLASGRSSTGSTSLAATTAAGGGYSLQVLDNSTDLGLPGYSGSWSANSTMTLTLRNAAGAVLAQDASSAKPKSLSASVAAGAYTLVASPTGGSGAATVTAGYPPGAGREVIGYDANDHATTTDDGATTASETLAPSGRVLRRVVTDDVSGAVSEDTSFGYDGPGDSPAYSRPTGGGPVTTYVQGPTGLAVTDVGGVASYPIVNGHGDVVGITDGAGNYTATPVTDEFGRGTPPSSRLGWLGAKERFSTGATLGLIRMGVRLYDPNLGRFLEVDPVEGGRENDYTYVSDPINKQDLSGEMQSCNNAQSAGPAGIMTLRRMSDIKRYQFTVELFPPYSTVAYSAGFHVKTSYDGRSLAHESDGSFKKWTDPDYLFHGRFDSRYGRKGRNAFQPGHVLELDLTVNPL
jgi:RHS repeat-associated protein